MEHDNKYSDQLLAGQDTLPTSTILEILLGYSQYELSQAEEASRRDDPKWIAQQIACTKRAKKTAGTNLGVKNYPQKPFKDKLEGFDSSNFKLKAAGKVFAILKKWMGIKFHNDQSGVNFSESYSTVVFFAWVIADDILGKLEAQVKGFKAPARAHEFIEYFSPNPITQRIESRIGPEARDEKPGKGTADPTIFIESLILSCENDIEIKIKVPNKPPITCNPDSLGFRDTNTKQWKALIDLLKSADGTFIYSKSEGDKKRAWGEIERKLRDFLNSKFDLNLPNDFKLFPLTQEAGVRKPIFQIHKPEDKSQEDFSTLGKDQIVEKIRELSISPDIETADLLNKAVARAKELGLSDDYLSKLLQTDDLLPSEILSLDNIDSTLLVKDRLGIDGKQQKPERNRDVIED